MRKQDLKIFTLILFGNIYIIMRKRIKGIKEDTVILMLSKQIGVLMIALIKHICRREKLDFDNSVTKTKS